VSVAIATAKENGVRILNQTVETVAVTDLKTHPRNVNQGDLGAIHESITANGFWGTIVAQRSTGYVLAGNHRLMAAQQAGATEVPVAWVDVDDEAALRILLADNRTTRLGQDDPNVLAELLQELAASDAGLTGHRVRRRRPGRAAGGPRAAKPAGTRGGPRRRDRPRRRPAGEVGHGAGSGVGDSVQDGAR
jgi:hypothetical protein